MAEKKDQNVRALALPGPLTLEEEKRYQEGVSQRDIAHKRKKIGSTLTGPLTPEEEKQYKDYISQSYDATKRKRIGSTLTGPLTPEEEKQHKDYLSRGKKEKTPMEKAKSVADKVKKRPVAPMDNVERIFRENFEEPMAKRMKEWNFKSQGSERKSWDAPDKTVYEKPAGKAGPLPRSPESIGLPKIPKAPEALGLPPIPKPAAKPLVPPPPAAVAGSANVVPQTDPLAKFRPSSAGAMTGGPGAAAWDNSWEPSTPMYHQDAMEAEYEPRRAQNMERGDWLAGQSTDQLRQNLSLMSRKQDRPELRNIDAIEWFKKLQQGQR